MNVHKVNLCIRRFQPAHPPGIRGSFDIFKSGYCECATIGQLKWTKASQWTTGEVHLFVNKIYRCWRSLENAPPWKLPSCQMPHVCPVGWGWGRLGIDWYFSLRGRCSFSSTGKVTDTLDVEFGMEGFSWRHTIHGGRLLPHPSDPLNGVGPPLKGPWCPNLRHRTWCRQLE